MHDRPLVLTSSAPLVVALLLMAILFTISG